MELTEAQLDWLAEHFVHPGRAWIKPPPLEQSLIDLGLVWAETFPFADGIDVIVLSLTMKGWAEAVDHKFPDVQKHLDKFDMWIVRKVQMMDKSLGQLPEFLGSGDGPTREAAIRQLDALLKETEDDRS